MPKGYFWRVFATFSGLVILLAGSVLPANAQIPGECDYEINWLEQNADNFVILYPSDQQAIADHISQSFGERINQDFYGFEDVFGIGLVTPITIRVYPSVQDYLCLNSLAPTIVAGSYHAHLGSREISLIQTLFEQDFEDWETNGAQSIRFELLQLFVEEITSGQTPPGLLRLIAEYSQDPMLYFEDLYQISGLTDIPESSWPGLWENGGAMLAADRIQGISTVAYLIDVYGWDSFVIFLNNLSSSNGYRDALLNGYGLTLQDLQEHWRQYFPVYVQGRWRANAFNQFDLTVFEELIEAGAYPDAASGLSQAIPLLRNFGDHETLVEAQALLQEAQLGVEANALVGQTREHILSGEFEQALDSGYQALEYFTNLGNNDRFDEIIAYLEWAEEVASLRGELRDIQDSESGALLRAQRLASIGRRLAELGDDVGVEEVNLILRVINTTQRVVILWIIALLLVVCVGLLSFRIIRIVRPLPPEADLL